MTKGKQTAKKQLKSAAPKPVKKTAVQSTAPTGRLASVKELARMTSVLLWRHRRLFLGITLVYALLNALLVQGSTSSTDVAGLKDTIQQFFAGDWGAVATGTRVFAL
jgi:hypothetical protein